MAEPLQLEEVRLSEEGAFEMDQHRPVISVPRAEITGIEIAFGSGAERPTVLIILGVLCLGIAVIPVLLFIAMLAGRPGTLEVKILTAVAFAIPGWWFLDLGIRKRWFLRVHTHGGSRKLVFHHLKDRAAIDSFVDEATRRFGYLRTGGR